MTALAPAGDRAHRAAGSGRVPNGATGASRGSSEDMGVDPRAHAARSRDLGPRTGDVAGSVTRSYISIMSLKKSTKSALSPGGKHGLAKSETRDPIGYAVAALNRFAQSELIDRLGPAQDQRAGRLPRPPAAGFRAARPPASRQFDRAGKRGAAGKRVAARRVAEGLFDLTPTEDEQMLVDVVNEFASRGGPLRPRPRPTTPAPRPRSCSRPASRSGCPILGVPEELGGIFRGALRHGRHPGRRGAGQGRHGPRRRHPGPRRGRHGDLACGAPRSSSRPTSRPSPATTSPPRRSRWPSPPSLFDPLAPATTATRDGDGFVLDGVKSAVVRGAEAELFVVGAQLDGTPGAVPRRVRRPPASRSRPTRRWACAPPVAVAGCTCATSQVGADAAARRRPTASTTPSACGSPGWPGARWPSAPARPCSTTSRVRQRARGVRRADQPPPVGGLHGRQHRDRAAGDAAADLQGRQPRPPRARTSPARSRWPASCAPRRACRSASTASSCSAATASSRSTRSSGGTATCGPSASWKVRCSSDDGDTIDDQPRDPQEAPAARRPGPPGRDEHAAPDLPQVRPRRARVPQGARHARRDDRRALRVRRRRAAPARPAYAATRRTRGQGRRARTAPTSPRCCRSPRCAGATSACCCRCRARAWATPPSPRSPTTSSSSASTAPGPAMAITEPGTGSDSANITTTARQGRRRVRHQRREDLRHLRRPRRQRRGLGDARQGARPRRDQVVRGPRRARPA